MQNEIPDFYDYISNARDEFVIKFNALYPDANSRVIAEDLLIAYDQMKEILQSTPPPAPAEHIEPVATVKYTKSYILQCVKMLGLKVNASSETKRAGLCYQDILDWFEENFTTH